MLNQILEVSKTKPEKEQIKSDVKDCKVRVEGFLKNMINLNENSVKRCKEYSNSKEKNLKEYLRNNLTNLEKKKFRSEGRII